MSNGTIVHNKFWDLHHSVEVIRLFGWFTQVDILQKKFNLLSVNGFHKIKNGSTTNVQTVTNLITL